LEVPKRKVKVRDLSKGVICGRGGETGKRTYGGHQNELRIKDSGGSDNVH
jgi:hypothetical protein